MRLERKSLIAVTLLFITGCSANRQTLQSDNEYDLPESVPMPMRHADEYDSGTRQYDYDSTPPQGKSPTRSASPVPTREPAPAPPAIGVSRVKSVSWLRGAARQHDGDSCSDPACGDGCSTGQQSRLKPEFFAEGCVTPRSAVVTPRRQCREKTTLMETIHGWNLRAKTRRAERARRSMSCGGQAACDPGCFAPEGCQTSGHDGGPSHKSPQVMQQNVDGEAVGQNAGTHGNLAGPLRENGWDDRSGAKDPRFSPDELLELPSTLSETPVDGRQQSKVQIAPMLEATPVLAVPKGVAGQSPAVTGPNPAAPPTVPRQSSSDSVKQIVQPPLWHRLDPPTASPANIPVASPGIHEDSSLPAIQPGRRI